MVTRHDDKKRHIRDYFLNLLFVHDFIIEFLAYEMPLGNNLVCSPLTRLVPLLLSSLGYAHSLVLRLVQPLRVRDGRTEEVAGVRGEYDVRRNEPRSPWCGPSLHLTDSSFSSVPVSLAFRSSITSALPFGHRKEN